MNEDIRTLVRVVEIDAVNPIPDADSIEVASVGGWSVVVGKGEFVEGNSAVYFEIDSCLPLADERFAFLRPRGFKIHEGAEYHRLKTVKLRGQVSQGLLIPFEPFLEEWKEATHNVLGEERFNLDELLGVLKYDDITPTATMAADAEGPWPSALGRKTDSERVQNLTGAWDDLLAEGDWIATEKIDGTSLSVFRDEGVLKVCSRNWQIKEGDNVYWNAVRANSDIFDNLYNGDGVQAEIYGEGIQGNRLGMTGKHIAIFSFLTEGVPEPRSAWPLAVLAKAAPEYPLTLPESPSEALAQVDGIKSQVSPSRLAEGVVWQHPTGKAMKVLGDRPNFKVISNKYLLKEK